MPRTVALDQQFFDRIRERNFFYIDKTAFIRDWWRAGDTVTLITRPRRFGKTLMMSTAECFFSMKYAGRSDLFGGLDVWDDATMRGLQGTFPVIFLSLADVKPVSHGELRETVCRMLARLFSEWRGVLEADLNQTEMESFNAVCDTMNESTAKGAVKFLCGLLERHFGKKVIILLDEYDTPMQEAWLGHFWDEAAAFLRGFFNATFKTNPHLERALLTGITRVSRESLFSDVNNLNVISTTTPQYETAFGFTEAEVFAAMDEYGFPDREGVKAMYDGFIFGSVPDIYNPWSVVSYLKNKGLLEPWWANTSSNALVGKLVREGDADLKQDFMVLLEGGAISSEIDEQVVFDQLSDSPAAVWSLLMASGYLKAVSKNGSVYSLKLTNGEVRLAFEKLVKVWFDKSRSRYNLFIKALLEGDLDYMNDYMNEVSLACFSSFDTGNRPGKSEPERFYHGVVLGLLVELRGRYIISSNRESGFGRHDIMLEPLNPAKDDAIIIEFKVQRPKTEKDLEDTVAAALTQIEAKAYARQLVERGIPSGQIRKYGFAFRGKEVLIGQA